MDGSGFQRVLGDVRSTSRSAKQIGDRFERLMLDFFKNDSRYRYDFRDIWLWMEYPNREHRDLGIDIVVRTRAGEQIAIQCKCYKETSEVTKKSIDSFLGALGKREFHSGIIVSTTNKWSDNAEKALQGLSKKCVRIGLESLEGSDVDWWALYTGSGASTPTKKRLRPHQKKALQDVCTGFRRGKRGKLIMPCGTGKTLTALRIVEKVAGSDGKVLVLVPSLSLVSQIHREFMQNTFKDIRAFIVCSDKKAGQDGEDIGIVDLALPPTTDVKELVEKMHSVPKGEDGLAIIFSTYHSINVVSKAQKKAQMGAFDLIVCDEAHRTTGIENRNTKKGSYWTKVHHDREVKANKRLYMTATPRIYEDADKNKARDRKYDIFSMDEKRDYGEVFHELTFSKAISQGLLSDYKVIVLGVDPNVIPYSMQESFARDGETKAEEVLKMIGCWRSLGKRFLNDRSNVLNESRKDIKDRRPMQRAVAFSGTIATSKRFKNCFEKIAKVLNNERPENPSLECKVRHVDGKMNSLTRGQNIRWLKEYPGKGQCRVLSNVRCLSEGVDVPSLDAVLFFESKRSKIDIIQSVGRVMRKPSDPSQKKEFGYIILPVVIRSDIELSKELKDKNYGVIWDVVKALRSHDDRLRYSYSPSRFIFKTWTGKSGKGEIDEGPPFLFNEAWEEAIVAKLVLKCGNREYLDRLALDVTESFQGLSGRMRCFLKNQKDSEYKKVLMQFLTSLRSILNDSISQDDAVDMLAMHSVAKPVFQALFERNNDFLKNNPVSQSMDKVLSVFGKQINAETKNLKSNYESIKKRVSDIDTLEGRQNLIKDLYTIIFKKGFPKKKKQFGIVYTPVEIVDFILESSDEILRREFGGKRLSNKNVTIVDPFSGTGSFISRLLENERLIRDEDLKHKYNHEMLSCEFTLLGYYTGAINIESSYHFRKKIKKGYSPFRGAVFADTFQSMERDVGSKIDDIFSENDKRRRRLNSDEIMVIVGNPPYSVGQTNENDNSKKMKYEILDDKIKETYVKDSERKLKRSLYDSYVRAIKWATEKIHANPNGGVVAFVTNASFIDGCALDGLRHHLQKDFTALYVFHLRGNLRTRGEISKKEGGNIFGQSTRIPIAISFLIKVPDKTGCMIHYHDIGDYLSTSEKLKKIKEFRHIFSMKDWVHIEPDKHGDWVSQRDSVFDRFFPMEKVFEVRSCGMITSRDAWVYNHKRNFLSKNIQNTIAFYSSELKRFEKGGSISDIDKFVNNDSAKISWSRRLKQSLRRGIRLRFSAGHIRRALYRPFCKKFLYYDKMLNEWQYQSPKLYPDANTRNLSICISGSGATTFSVLMTDIVPDLNLLGGACQYFARYCYRNGIREDNIPKSVVVKFRNHYNDSSIGFDEVFFYVYGLLHSRRYVEKYGNNLVKDLPRMPMVDKFHEFSRIGRELSDLHVGYESAPIHKLDIDIDAPKRMGKTDLYRVEKMKHPKEGKDKDTSTIIYNDWITINGIPKRAHEFKINGLSAIKHIMDRYQVRTDKKSGIVNDPNRKDDPKYILNLLQRIVHVSMRTLELVDELPAFDVDAGASVHSAAERLRKAVPKRKPKKKKATRVS